MNPILLPLHNAARKLFRAPLYRMRLKNREASILCNNCAGGCIAHDLHLQFRSPFVNLWLSPTDFIKYCEDIRHYRNAPLQFIQTGQDYPIARLDDITIHFLHYRSEAEAEKKWTERTRRMDTANIRCILVAFGECTEQDIRRFHRLPYPTAALVHLPGYQNEHTHLIRGFENEPEIGNVTDYKPLPALGRRFYDDFDFVGFLNSDSQAIQSCKNDVK